MKVLPVQIILLIGAVLFVWYVQRLRTLLFDRLILFILALFSFALILNPDFSSEFAHLIGVGRGVDLIFYFFIIYSLFRFVGISADQRETRKMLTNIVRANAIQNARFGGFPKKS